MFRNTADNHPQDIAIARNRLHVLVADFGLPDLLALMSEEIRKLDDYGMREVRAVLDTRANLIAAIGETVR